MYGNSNTGESGAATVSTTDCDAIDESQIVREMWLLRIRKQFAEREGWTLAETTVIVDESSVQLARVSFESAILCADQMARERFNQDKLLFDLVAAIVVNIRAGNDTTPHERLLQESPAMLKLIAGGWEVMSAFTELFRLQRAAPHRRVLVDELDSSIEDPRSRRLVRLCVTAMELMSVSEAARIAGRALDAAVDSAPPPPPPAARQLLRQVSSQTTEHPELQTTEALKMATVRLSGSSFQRTAKRVAEVVAACSAEHPAAEAEWAEVNGALQTFEARGWLVSDAAGLLRIGVRDADVICAGVDPRSAVLCHLMLRLVNEQARPLPPQDAPPARAPLPAQAAATAAAAAPCPSQARRAELAEMSASIAALSARLEELRAHDAGGGGPRGALDQEELDLVAALEASLRAELAGALPGQDEGEAGEQNPEEGGLPPPPAPLERQSTQEQLELAMALSLSESLAVAAAAAAAEASSPRRATLAGLCPICMDRDGEAFRPSACAHEMHRTCAVAMVRAALGSARSDVLPSGVRCPCRPTLGCAEFITMVDCATLVREVVPNEPAAAAAAASADEDDEAARCLSPEEFESLNRFAVEATVPENEKLFCPACERMILLDVAGEIPTGMAQCPHCDNLWSPSAASGEDAATTVFLDATSKRCPTCGVRSTHYHGHDCHHIGYGSGGCLTCKQHWCYVCLRKHGTPQGDGTATAFTSMSASRNPECPHGSSFCNRNDIAAHLVQAPYPHDSRCGCPICPTCRPGAPCGQCSGNCVVCLSLVPPGPSELAAT